MRSLKEAIEEWEARDAASVREGLAKKYWPTPEVKERPMRKLAWEVADSKLWPGEEWVVEAIEMLNDGEVYRATFSGPGAEQYARAYAKWKNGQGASDGDGP